MATCDRCHRALYQEDYDAGKGLCPECRAIVDAAEAKNAPVRAVQKVVDKAHARAKRATEQEE